MVAVATAYLVALQLLLTSAVATQMSVAGTDPASHFCFGDPANTSDGSGSADDALVNKTGCPICVFASQAPLVPVVSLARVERFAQHSVHLSHSAVAFHSEQQHSPRTSQGPPQTF